MSSERQGAVDLRSDTVTRPTAAMRAAMAAAEVGDDVYGDDPTVNRLQAELAARLGFEAGLFMPSGTQGNLAAMLGHCGRGEAVILGARAHAYLHEAGGAAALGGIHSFPLEPDDDGSLAPERIAAAIQPDDVHCPRTRLLALENTINGQVVPLARCAEAIALARRHGLATHLDGARLFNAAVALGVAPCAVAAGFDSVSVCLSKGLGAPVGSVLLGTAAFVERARRARKILGGGLRQAGVLAAAGLYALEHHVERLAEDHAHAQRLAAGLARIDGLEVVAVNTNMVFVDVPAGRTGDLAARLAGHGVIVSCYGPRVRLVTHLDVDVAGVDRAVAAFARVLAA